MQYTVTKMAEDSLSLEAYVRYYVMASFTIIRTGTLSLTGKRKVGR